MLNVREPKLVNGPEVRNKSVGAMEENVCKLFEDAEKDQAAHGNRSELHAFMPACLADVMSGCVCQLGDAYDSASLAEQQS